MQLPIKRINKAELMFAIFATGRGLSFAFGLGWNSNKSLQIANVNLYSELNNFKEVNNINMNQVSIHNNFRDVIDNIESLDMSEIRIYTMFSDFTNIELYASLKTHEDLMNYNAKHPRGMTL